MPDPKKPFINDVTIVAANFLNAIFGGDDGYKTTIPPSPFFAGHFHDVPDGQAGSEWGHAPKINLTDHVTGTLTLPQPELKSIRLSATQATPLTSSIYWTMPIPADAYVASPKPFFLKIFWSANGPISPGNVAFRIDWTYIQAGQNVMPPSIIARGSDSWPANTVSANNPDVSTMRFKASGGASASVLYVNENVDSSNLIQLNFPGSVVGATFNQFLLFGLEISSAPTVTLSQPMAQVNIFGIELQYYSQSIGINNSSPSLLLNDPGLADF
jgi:hypothetical protein